MKVYLKLNSSMLLFSMRYEPHFLEAINKLSLRIYEMMYIR